ncbi:54S ribosomal protein img2, mitochondrial [Smittium culicis]|uniref:Large ribosomal subunit protein mL49 n=1 Tax=Smittium culicis TaxID=133412 RepID=A0A1R1YG47_9FUNG|nr:54S ribosomal protein img2, mitochondrial [Smittium culicis]
MFPISQSISKISKSSIQLCRQMTIRHLSTIKVSDQSTIASKPSTQLRYFIQRTSFKSLPIYTEFKNNGSRKLTIIRKIEGDLNALKSDLDPLFGKENVSIKKINNSILIKGICSREVRQFLSKKGF